MRRPALFSLSLFLALPAFAHGHEEGPPKEAEPKEVPEFEPKTPLEHLEVELRLDDKQRDKVKAILEEGDAKGRAKGAEMMALMEKVKALQKDLDEHGRQVEEKIREVLTWEQKDRFDEMRMRRRQGPPRREGGEGGPEGPPPGWTPGRGGPGGPRGDRDPASFPPEMWHEHAPPGAPPKGRDRRMNPRPDDQPPGAPPEPEDGD